MKLLTVDDTLFQHRELGSDVSLSTFRTRQNKPITLGIEVDGPKSRLKLRKLSPGTVEGPRSREPLSTGRPVWPPHSAHPPYPCVYRALVETRGTGPNLSLQPKNVHVDGPVKDSWTTTVRDLPDSPSHLSDSVLRELLGRPAASSVLESAFGD